MAIVWHLMEDEEKLFSEKMQERAMRVFSFYFFVLLLSLGTPQGSLPSCMWN